MVPVHELGHLLCAVFLRRRVSSFRILSMRPFVHAEGTPTPFFYAAGPLSNIILGSGCFAATACFPSASALLFAAGAGNIIFGALNFLPIDGFDGGAIFRNRNEVLPTRRDAG